MMGGSLSPPPLFCLCNHHNEKEMMGSSMCFRGPDEVQKNKTKYVHTIVGGVDTSVLRSKY
jgi:hypothetical protein